ncbi:MAG: RDD family protein [Actinomycetota bacterium]|nr:RDD family protein [Actinomycetota bacterium]
MIPTQGQDVFSTGTAAPVIARDDLASPGQRLAAAFIDGLVLFVPMVVVLALTWDANADPNRTVASLRWPLVAVGLLTAVYQVVGVALWGKTVGKLLVHIRICSADDLGRPGWVRALIRWGIFWIVGWIPFLGGLASIAFILPLLWTLKRQGVHDMAAGTLVVRDGV